MTCEKFKEARKPRMKKSFMKPKLPFGFYGCTLKKHASASCTSGRGSDKKTVFPSVQMRIIVNLEQLIGEATINWNGGSTEVGFKSLSEGNITGYISKLEIKTDTQHKVDNWIAANNTRDGDSIIDLHVRGEQALQDAIECKRKAAFAAWSCDELQKDRRQFGGHSSILDSNVPRCSALSFEFALLLLQEAV